MKQEQEELAFDRKILEQLLAQSKTEQKEQSQRKVILTFVNIHSPLEVDSVLIRGH